MILYKLSKQLKEAGFPQKGDGGYNVSRSLPDGRECCIRQQRIEDTEREDLYFYTPTLEELIYYCGDRFGMLKRTTGKDIVWVAFDNTIPVSDSIAEVGYSPEEAVANLWLKLNKK